MASRFTAMGRDTYLLWAEVQPETVSDTFTAIQRLSGVRPRTVSTSPSLSMVTIGKEVPGPARKFKYLATTLAVGSGVGGRDVAVSVGRGVSVGGREVGVS